jgi:hypothetical protein
MHISVQGRETYSCIGAAEAADPALRSPVEPEEREDMDMEAVAHGLVLLVVYLQEQHIRVPFGELSNLHIKIKELYLAQRKYATTFAVFATLSEWTGVWP